MPKHYERKAHVVVNVKADLTSKYKPKWSSESLGIFFGLTAILLAIIVPAFLLLFLFCPVINYIILLTFLLIAGLIIWWRRYSVLMLIRKLEDKLGGEKTYHSH